MALYLENYIRRKVYKLLNRPKFDPFVGGNDASLTLLNLDNVKFAVEQALYSTQLWPRLSSAPHGLLTGDSTTVIKS